MNKALAQQLKKDFSLFKRKFSSLNEKNKEIYNHLKDNIRIIESSLSDKLNIPIDDGYNEILTPVYLDFSKIRAFALSKMNYQQMYDIIITRIINNFNNKYITKSMIKSISLNVYKEHNTFYSGVIFYFELIVYKK